MGYGWTKPTYWYNNLRINFNAVYSRRLLPSVYQNANFNLNVNGQLKNLWQTGFFMGYEPAGNNYYEPHMDGRFFKGWKSTFTGGFVQTNNAKKYQLYTELFYVTRSFFAGKKYSVELRQRFRFTDKLSISYGILLAPQTNNVGFADIENNNIIFGKRNIQAVENTFSTKFNFNKKMGLRTDIRHYWSKVDYRNPAQNFYKLLLNGTLEPISNYNGNVNQNYNAFNVDAVFTWEFAPGSFINAVWKNINSNFDQTTKFSYLKNLGNTLDQSHTNNISFKILYFLDYLQLKKKKKKND